MTVTIRRIEARDEARWRELWDGYTRFYEREPSEPMTRHAWSRILDRCVLDSRQRARIIRLAPADKSCLSAANCRELGLGLGA